jgi:hypothetical protein
VLEAAERITGVAVLPLTEATRLQETDVEYRGKMRELQDLAYTVMDYVGGAPEDLRSTERRRLAQKARNVHREDPQYGGTINLLNEFVLGRGIPKPQANDPEVQAEIDEFWDDPDNQLVLTTQQAQVRLNTDLSLQSNIFPLVYDDGDDGRVKLGWLPHDDVENAIRDPDFHLRILYYLAKTRRRTWDVQNHVYKVEPDRTKVRYYEEFRNLQVAQEDVANGAQRDEPLPEIPPALVGKGRVVHVALNRTMGQAFGVPEIARTIRWLSAYNDLMRARVDMAKAAASIIARRKLKGATAQQLANQALRLSGGSVVAPDELARAPRPGSILNDIDGAIETDSFNLNSGSQGAMQDAQMIRSQISGGTGWPASYLGDPNAMALSTATSLELRVLKLVEARQQILEDLIRLLVDHKIQRAIDAGRLSKWRPMTTEERKRELQKQDEEQQAREDLPPVPEAVGLLGDVTTREEEDEPPDGMTERDLSYQVSVPSPLRRAMADLITGVANIAKTFDPNNTNLELSKLLLGIALGEGMEVEDPAAAVERIFPDGYVDPAVQAATAAAGAPPDGSAAGGLLPFPGPGVGPDGQNHPNPDNPYGAPMQAQPPEAVMQAADLLSDRMALALHARDGSPVPRRLQEAIVARARGKMVAPAQRAAAMRQEARSASQRAVSEADDALDAAVSRALEMVS